MLFFYPKSICQEEEDDSAYRGGGSRPSTIQNVALERFLDRLMEERHQIIHDEKLGTKDKVQLLETSRYPLAVASGRGIAFKTEQIVKWMLAYSMVVVVILATLTALGRLEKEVTVSFIGTVVGGLIATVAQKLGKV